MDLSTIFSFKPFDKLRNNYLWSSKLSRMYMNVYIFFLTRRRVINLYSLQFPQNVSPVPVPSDTSNSSISTRYQIYLSLHLLIRVSSESRESFAIYDPAECNARVNNNWLIAKSTKFRSGHFSKNPPSRHAFEPRIWNRIISPTNFAGIEASNASRFRVKPRL